jgi:LmbE family N-acetylglucosaminyl deacetylase
MLSKKTVKVVDTVPERVMAIGAHPDDVELGAGGVLAKWAELGAEVTVVVCTDGGAGTDNYSQAASELIAIRRKEQQLAVDDLGVQHLTMLGYADGALEDTPDFRGVLVKLIRRHRPEVVLSHDPYRRSRFVHRDHRITGQVTLDAIYPYARDHLHYPQQISDGLATHKVDCCLLWDTDEPNAIVDVSGVFETRRQALRRHASQLDGILGDSKGKDWLRERSEEAAANFDFGQGEVFRLLKAPL